MRYFKYRNTKKNLNAALKEQYLSLTKEQKCAVRRKKLLTIITRVLFYAIFFSSIVVGTYLLTLIPKPNSVGLEILYYFGMVLLGFILLVVSCLLAYIIILPLWKQVDEFNLPAIKKEIFSKACAHLRDYYQLQEPYIITKCYNSTDEKFTNHDVCIFVAGDELRITADLIHGFLYGNRDLGCYALKKEDICVSKKQKDKLLIAELTTKDKTFNLGYRAKSFIEKYLTDNIK